jgi:hypothetical protein
VFSVKGGSHSNQEVVMEADMHHINVNDVNHHHDGWGIMTIIIIE